MIICPDCGTNNTHCYSTEPSWNKNHNSYKRYRKCMECGKRFITIEQTTEDIRDYYKDMMRTLAEMRAAMNCQNSDYKIGYLSAVSYLEGYLEEIK